MKFIYKTEHGPKQPKVGYRECERNNSLVFCWLKAESTYTVTHSHVGVSKEGSGFIYVNKTRN